MPNKPLITISALIKVPLDRVWNFWTEPEHIMHWNYASDDWHAPAASNDLRKGGRFTCRMEAKDGSAGFDFAGTYTKVPPQTFIESILDDSRKLSVTFEDRDGATYVTETFEAEELNPVEMQQQGWQAILDTFKEYAESQTQTP